MKMILGIFNGIFFKKLKSDFEALSYGDISIILSEEDFDFYENVSLIEIIYYGCHKAESIIFLLDGIRFPLNTEESITCEELELIMNNETFLEKTKFFLEGQIVDKTSIIKTYLQSKESQSSKLV